MVFMLCGSMPKYEDLTTSLLSNNCSKATIHLINVMLQQLPDARPTAKTAKEHVQFLRQILQSNPAEDIEINNDFQYQLCMLQIEQDTQRLLALQQEEAELIQGIAAKLEYGQHTNADKVISYFIHVLHSFTNLE